LSKRTRLAGLGTLFLMPMAVPRVARAYVDPGSGAMLWQMAGASVMGTLFYFRRIARRVQARMRLRSARSTGFFFGHCAHLAYTLVTSPLVSMVFGSQPLSRFNDVFLVGIVLNGRSLYLGFSGLSASHRAGRVGTYVPPYGRSRSGTSRTGTGGCRRRGVGPPYLPPFRAGRHGIWPWRCMPNRRQRRPHLAARG
jgi:hypothetical protein